MHIIKLQGGLGNQMFQYAFARGLQHHYGTDIMLDAVDLEAGEGITRRRYALDAFLLGQGKAATKFATPTQSARYNRPLRRPFLATLAVLVGQKPTEIVIQPSLTKLITWEPRWQNQDAYFLGLWQNPAYFAGCQDDVRQAFTFRTPLSGKAAVIAHTMSQNETLAIQVRRGDYVSNPKVQKILYVTDTEYFNRALEYVFSQKKITHIIVVSDDIAWCQQELHLPVTSTFVPKDISDVDSLHLMSLAQHAIISNSSFGWWGAWLSRNPSKIVVAPEHWYRKDGDSAEIIPASWTRM